MTQILKMKKEHIDKVCEIESLCIETPWGKDSLLKEIENEKAIYFCAVKDEEVIGYIGLWNILGEGNITNVAVHPDFQRMGTGYLLMEKMKEYAKKEKLLFLTLEVNEGNEKAISLYKKCGFETVGLRKKYYDNKYNAVLMNYNI